MSVSLLEPFRQLIAEIEHNHPGLAHEKKDEGESLSLSIPKSTATGFDVLVQVWKNEVHIETDRGWHSYECEVSVEQLSEMMGLVRNLLSPTMRIREFTAGGSPYSWKLEAFDGSKWLCEGSTTLLFWNYFGRRAEGCFQNIALPARSLRTHDEAT